MLMKMEARKEEKEERIRQEWKLKGWRWLQIQGRMERMDEMFRELMWTWREEINAKREDRERTGVEKE